MDGGFVVGLDAGGTSTRAVVLDPGGRRLGVGRAGGANPNSHPPEQAADQIRQALCAALDEIDPAGISAGVLGMAGSSKLTDPAVADLFESAWRAAGLRCPLRVVTDCEAAFAAGTPAPSGTVLVAGTGSIAARIEDRQMVGSVGGYGWLLGDEGSAFWLGREAVRATLAALLPAPATTGTAPGEGGATSGELGELAWSVLGQALDMTTRVADLPPAERETSWKRLITAVNAEAPIRLARFAPLVSAAVLAGDPAAEAIVTRAAQLLADTALAARTPGEDTPVVLVGSLVEPGNPVGDRLRVELAARCPGEVHTVTDASTGSAWLAALSVLGPAAPRPK
nr:BadF/BadG/BcrA/BcrD ATPase family protein [Goodfellowiella coeruleoviolacea]